MEWSWKGEIGNGAEFAAFPFMDKVAVRGKHFLGIWLGRISAEFGVELGVASQGISRCAGSGTRRSSRMKVILEMALGIPLVLAVVDAVAAGESARPVTRPADELFWVPTLDQAIAMGEANKVPIIAMGYSLVGDRSTYTKFGEDCASTVF